MAQQPITPWTPTTGLNSYPTIAAVPELAETTPMATANADAATRTVGNDELMSNQVNKLIAQDSPLMQQAAGNAAKAANSRGLLNSSMAVQAGQAAVMDRAMPIAQYDAGVNTNVANNNQANQQQTNVFNAGNEQSTNQFNASEANKVNIINASESNKILAQMMDKNTRLQLGDIEAQYKTLMQSQASAMSTYQQAVKNISEILMNPDLDGPAKTQAVANQNALLKTGMQIVGKLSGLNLDDLLTFPEYNASNPA